MGGEHVSHSCSGAEVQRQLDLFLGGLTDPGLINTIPMTLTVGCESIRCMARPLMPSLRALVSTSMWISLDAVTTDTIPGPVSSQMVDE